MSDHAPLGINMSRLAAEVANSAPTTLDGWLRLVANQVARILKDGSSLQDTTERLTPTDAFAWHANMALHLVLTAHKAAHLIPKDSRAGHEPNPIWFYVAQALSKQNITAIGTRIAQLGSHGGSPSEEQLFACLCELRIPEAIAQNIASGADR